jgi:predicted permease
VIFVHILLPIFLVVAAGALFSRTYRAPLEPLAVFALHVATPALIFEALLSHPVPGGDLARVFFVMMLYTAVLWGLSEAVSRVMGLDADMRRAFALATVTMNVGNYGLPLVRFAFGPSAVPFSVLVFVVFNIPLSTWAIWVAAGGGTTPARSVLDTLRVPIFHATALSFALNALGLTLPGPVLKACALVGEASIPLLMVVLGMQLERTRIAGPAGPLAAASLVRLGAAPVVAWALSRALGLGGMETKILVVQTSTPSAVLPLLYAMRFKRRPDWLASNLLISTLVSGASLGVVLWLLL